MSLHSFIHSLTHIHRKYAHSRPEGLSGRQGCSLYSLFDPFHHTSPQIHICFSLLAASLSVGAPFLGLVGRQATHMDGHITWMDHENVEHAVWVVASVWGGSESHPSQFWLSGVGCVLASLVVGLSVGAHIFFGGCDDGGLVGVGVSVVTYVPAGLSVCLPMLLMHHARLLPTSA